MRGFRTKTDSVGSVDMASHWIPYSDLMAGLLCVFALLLIVYVKTLGEPLEKIRELIGQRNELVQDLKVTFREDIRMGRVTIARSGALVVGGDILFPLNESELSPDGESVLLNLIPRYVEALRSNSGVWDQLRQIRVDGHADDTPPRGEDTGSVGAYTYNLELSQDRARSVVRFLVESDALARYRDDIERYFVPAGRSSMDLVLAEDGSVDRERSRRIEITIELKDGELVEDLIEEYANKLEWSGVAP